MSGARRARRRRDRERIRRVRPTRSFSPLSRGLLLVGGILCILAGIALLTAGGPGNAARLGRIAGILILLGIIAGIFGAVGRM